MSSALNCTGKRLPPPQQRQKLLPRLRRRAHTPQHTRRRRRTARLLHAAHNHAQVRGLHDDADAAGFEDFGDGQRDLFREPFLDL